MVVQVAVSLALVVAAGLFVRTFSHLTQVPLGFDRSDTLLVTIRAPTVPGNERNALYHRLVKAVAAVPGVEFAGGSMNAPLAGTLVGDFVVSQPGTPPPPGAERIRQSDWVTPGMFAAFGIAVGCGTGLRRTRHSGHAESDHRERSVRATVLSRRVADRATADVDISRAGRLFAGHADGRGRGARRGVPLDPNAGRADRVSGARPGHESDSDDQLLSRRPFDDAAPGAADARGQRGDPRSQSRHRIEGATDRRRGARRHWRRIASSRSCRGSSAALRCCWRGLASTASRRTPSRGGGRSSGFAWRSARRLRS